MANEKEIKVRHRARPATATSPSKASDEAPAVSQGPPDEGDGDYEVGYKKPPKNTRFKAGQSGNPGGRPKGSKSLKNLVGKELNDNVDIREGGRLKAVNKRVVVAKQLVKKGMEGHDRSIETILRLDDELEQIANAEQAAAEAAEKAEPLTLTERDILADLEAGLRAKIEREIEHRKIDDPDEPDTEEDAS